MKTAIEVEYWVVTDDGDLTTPGSLTDISDYVEPEFVEPMLEIKTSPCETMDELREELFARLRQVVRLAKADGKRLVPLGTPLNAPADALPYRESTSTDLQREIVGPAFGDARYCAGTHVHFEQSPGHVADQLNTLTALDPAFALVSTSPYYRGEHFLECARPYLYRKGCYSGFPEQGQLWPYVESAAEWETRLEEVFESFRERALERGVDATTFDEEFDPYTAVWTPIRLREQYPTVEWRSPDTALPSRVLELTADVRAVVERAVDCGTEIEDGTSAFEGETETRYRRTEDEPLSLPPFETVVRTVDAAMREGIRNRRVVDYLARRGLDPTPYDPVAGQYDATRVSRKQARRLRLEAADRLEADLLELSRPEPESDPKPTPADTRAKPSARELFQPSS